MSALSVKHPPGSHPLELTCSANPVPIVDGALEHEMSGFKSIEPSGHFRFSGPSVAYHPLNSNTRSVSR